MDPEIWARVNQWVVLNREDLYLIAVALVGSDTRCTCSLTYYFAHGSIPKRNDEDTSKHIAASHGNAKAANDLRAMDQPAAAGGITKGEGRPSERPQHLPGPCRCARGVNHAVLLMNLEDLYAIVVALVISNAGCTCALTYYFGNDSMVKRNAEETRQCITASCGVAQVVSARKSVGTSEHPLATDGSRASDVILLTVKDPLAATDEIKRDLGTRRSTLGSSSDISSVGSNAAFPVV